MNPLIEKFKATCNPDLQYIIMLIQAEAYAEGASDALALTPEELKSKTDKIKAKLNDIMVAKFN